MPTDAEQFERVTIDPHLYKAGATLALRGWEAFPGMVLIGWLICTECGWKTDVHRFPDGQTTFPSRRIKWLAHAGYLTTCRRVRFEPEDINATRSE